MRDDGASARAWNPLKHRGDHAIDLPLHPWLGIDDTVHVVARPATPDDLVGPRINEIDHQRALLVRVRLGLAIARARAWAGRAPADFNSPAEVHVILGSEIRRTGKRRPNVSLAGELPLDRRSQMSLEHRIVVESRSARRLLFGGRPFPRLIMRELGAALDVRAGL